MTKVKMKSLSDKEILELTEKMTNLKSTVMTARNKNEYVQERLFEVSKFFAEDLITFLNHLFFEENVTVKTGNILLPDENLFDKIMKQHANVGEYIKIVDKKPYIKNYNNGEIFKVEGRDLYRAGVYASNADSKNIFVYDSEYVVLEGYKPKK